MIAIKQRVITLDKRSGILRQTVIANGVKSALVDIDGKMFTMPYATLKPAREANKHG